MALYTIKYTETNVRYFAVEAADEYEAYDRFEEWRDKSDDVYDAMTDNMTDNWNIEGDAVVVRYPVRLDEEDILTEEKYKAL